jgi:RNA polymerase sigma-70 factor (ECF subfamily)
VDVNKELAVNKGDAVKPFEDLWEQMHEPICRFVCSRVSNEQDAEDILQDVFIRIYHQMGTVRDSERLDSWMYQIARNRIIDHYRKPRRWVDLPETIAWDEGYDESTMEALLPSIREMVDTLPEPYREALILSDFQRMPQQTLAGHAGVSLSGIKSRVQRARMKVKEALYNCFDFEFDTRGQLMNYSEHCC